VSVNIWDQIVAKCLSMPSVRRVLYEFAQHAARILATDGDRADLLTDDEAIGGPGGVNKCAPILGIPGARVVMQAGDRVRLVFDGGDATGRAIGGFESVAAADRAITRKGDGVSVGTLQLSNAPPSAPPGIVITYTGPQNPLAPSVPAIVIGQIVGAVSIAPDPLSLDLVGYVMAGSPEVFLRGEGS
jgi:hypothetical protein